MNSLRSCILMYDDGALTIRDWTLRISERSTHHAVIDTYNKFITDLFGKVKTRYGLSKANDLDIQLRSCSTDDLIRILYLHRSYITHFGLLVHEDSEGTPSDVMKAYLLYLLAVRSRDQGKTDDAFRIFHLLAETKALLPDLYRGKTHYHMGEMAEEKGDFRRAFEHYTACLERMPYHADARERADLLKGHLQITERATRTMDDRPADTRQVVL